MNDRQRLKEIRKVLPDVKDPKLKKLGEEHAKLLEQKLNKQL